MSSIEELRGRAKCSETACAGKITESTDVRGAHYAPLLLLGAAAGERKVFTAFGDDYPTVEDSCARDYIHVSDLADAYVKI